MSIVVKHCTIQDVVHRLSIYTTRSLGMHVPLGTLSCGWGNDVQRVKDAGDAVVH